MMNVVWVDLAGQLPQALTDYPATLARDAIWAALAEQGMDILTVSAEDVLSYAVDNEAIYLFSCPTPHWPTAVALAARLRYISPRSILVAGGYHVSALPNDKGVEFFDYVVVGEGEEAITGLVGRSRLSTGGASGVLSRPRVVRARRIRDLDALPNPLRNLNELRASRLRGLMFPPPSRQTGVASVLLSRGCNNRCSFCASHTIWGTRLATRDVEPVVQEIEHLGVAFGVNAMVLLDQAFGEDESWTGRLCRHLKERGVPSRTKWYCMAKTSINPTLLGPMAEAGCTKIGFGVETADPEMRSALKRADEVGLEELNGLFRACNAAGILVKAYFMIGFPWESPEYLMRTTRTFLENLEANELKITFFTPFPGTSDWKRYSNQLVTRDWRYFDTETIPVVRNPRIEPEEYHAIRKQLLRWFYGSGTYTRTWGKFVRRFPEYQASWDEFASLLKRGGQITGQEEWVRYCNPSLVSRSSVTDAALG